jgi:hypothetical protein
VKSNFRHTTEKEEIFFGQRKEIMHQDERKPNPISHFTLMRIAEDFLRRKRNFSLIFELAG